MTHGAPGRDARGAARARPSSRRGTAPCSRSTPRRPRSTRSDGRSPGIALRRAAPRPMRASASRSAATARSCARCAPTRGTPVPVFARQLRPGRLPRDGRARAACAEGFERALAGTLDVLQPAGDRARRAGADGHTRAQRRRGAPPGRRARRRALLRGRRRGGRQRALRRPGRRDARRLDRLQPRQRRAGDGVGRGGHGRLVHRAALAQRARARDRARRRADASTTARARRSRCRSTAARSARSRPQEIAARALRRRRRDAAADGGLELLPPPAREVRLAAVALRACRPAGPRSVPARW